MKREGNVGGKCNLRHLSNADFYEKWGRKESFKRWNQPGQVTFSLIPARSCSILLAWAPPASLAPSRAEDRAQTPAGFWVTFKPGSFFSADALPPGKCGMSRTIENRSGS